MSSRKADDCIVCVEPMLDADLESVVALEHQCGLSSRGVEKYRMALPDTRALLLVASCRGPMATNRQIVGVLSAIIIIDELQIDNVAVSEDRRRLGIASELLREGLSRAYQNGARTAVLELRSKNLPALSLYTRFGFVITGRRPFYYHDRPDDALNMTCEIERLISNPIS